MKSLLTIALLSLSTIALAKSEVRIVKSDSEKTVIKVANVEEIIISKKEFKTAADARKFCSQQKAKLDKEFSVFGLVMVAKTKDLGLLIEKAGGFQFGSQDDGFGGIWQWSGNGEKVIMIQNGHGTDTEEVESSEINKAVSGLLKAPYTLKLPAVCTKIF